MIVGYFAGPGDVCGNYRDWLKDPVAIERGTYSGQFFSLAGGFDHVVIVSSSSRVDFVRDGKFIIKNIPNLNYKKGLLFYIYDLLYKVRISFLFIKSNVDVVIVQSDWDMWTYLFLPIFGIKVINSVHCEIPDRRTFNGFLNRLFLNYLSSGVAAVSNRVLKSIQASAPNLVESHSFLPSLLFSDYNSIAPLRKSANVNFLYVGRIEENKGVLDLLSAFAMLYDSHKNVTLEYVGDGSFLDQLLSAVNSLSLSNVVRINGPVRRGELEQVYSRSDVVVVPTTRSFAEGFNKVIIEAIAWGRPVIATDVCPAVDEFRNSLISTPSDDPVALSMAMEQLLSYDARFKLVGRGLADLKFFLEGKRSWADVISGIVQRIAK